MNTLEIGKEYTVRGIDWYNSHKDNDGYVVGDKTGCSFISPMSKFCGKKVHILADTGEEEYSITEDGREFLWKHWMFL